MMDLSLTGNDLKQARDAYTTLYTNAFPASVCPVEKLEIATFHLADSFETFSGVGLGLETVVVYRDEDGTGHTGKILINLPGQLLPEHAHVDTFVLSGNSAIPDGFAEVKAMIRDFKGIAKTTIAGASAAKLRYPADDYVIVQAAQLSKLMELPMETKPVAVLRGKSETFKCVAGSAVLFADDAIIVGKPADCEPMQIPDFLRKKAESIRDEQVITTEKMLYLTPGVDVLLPKNTRHAVMGGPEGCVYIEFSTPSMDEADRFSDPRIIR